MAFGSLAYCGGSQISTCSVASDTLPCTVRIRSLALAAVRRQQLAVVGHLDLPGLSTAEEVVPGVVELEAPVDAMAIALTASAWQRRTATSLVIVPGYAFR